MIQATQPKPERAARLDPLVDVEYAQDLLEGILVKDASTLPALALHELVIAARHVARAMAIAEAVAEGTLLDPRDGEEPHGGTTAEPKKTGGVPR